MDEIPSLPTPLRDADEELSGRIVEGVANEVTYVLILVFLFLVPFVYVLWKNGQVALQRIHPASQILVEEARRRLGIGASPTRAVPSAPPLPQRQYNQDRTCPICFVAARFAVTTNCGHLFCGQCIIAYWRYGNWLGPVKCAVCRSDVTILLPTFFEVDPAEPGRNQIENEINSYNRRFSGEPRPLMDYIRDIPVLIPHLLSMLFSMNGLLYMFRIRILVLFIGALVYVLSPLDIIPEAVFGVLGLLDDCFIFFMLMLYLCIAYRRMVGNPD